MRRGGHRLLRIFMLTILHCRRGRKGFDDMAKAYLLLADGSVMEGEGFGAAGTRIAELVFTTGMTGAAESLTDPSYAGQAVCFTFPQLGNYGVCSDDFESEKVHASAVVCQEYCDKPSNFRCEMTVGELLRRDGAAGIAGVDTRRITRLIRERGVMNAAVTDAPPTPELLAAVRAYKVSGAVAAASTAKPLVFAPPGARYSVALMDYGYKKSIAGCLTERGCAVTLYPHDTPAETVLAAGHDGVMLSNGPGDPAENLYEIAQIRALMGRLPMFGICLGHQMMALAQGAATAKMKFGHRGANQPAKDLRTGRVYVTSQNHGYAVEAASLAGGPGVLRFANVNDGSVEGLDYPGLGAFSVQFHPEAHGGPRDSEGLFDRFISMLGGGRDA